MNLSTLTSKQLSQLDSALNIIDGALDMLLERGICTEDDGVDLVELSEAVGAEIASRADADGEYAVQVMMGWGEAVAVVRPDGQQGYAPLG